MVKKKKKTPCKGWKKQAANQGKIFANVYPKGQIPRLYAELPKLNIKEKIIQLENGQKRLHFLPFFPSFLFMATPAAYESSQARDQMGVAAAGLRHSHGNTGI